MHGSFEKQFVQTNQIKSIYLLTAAKKKKKYHC